MTTGHGRAFICVCERVSVCESVCVICWTAEEEECVRRTDEAGLLHEDAQPTIDGFIDHFDLSVYLLLWNIRRREKLAAAGQISNS